MSDFIFPQDEGTGVPNGEATWLDAANLAAHAYDALGAHIAEGLSVTAPGDGTIDVAAGLARLYSSSVSTKDHGSGQQTRSQGNIFTVVAESRSGLSLPDGSGTNYVYVSADPSVTDSVSVSVNATESEPSGPSLKIAEVDAGSNTVTVTGKPDLDVGQIALQSLTGEIANGGTLTGLIGTGLAIENGDLSASISHSDLTSFASNDHHSKTQPSDIDSSNWNDYEIQKDGQDGAGIINFKTQ